MANTIPVCDSCKLPLSEGHKKVIIVGEHRYHDGCQPKVKAPLNVPGVSKGLPPARIEPLQVQETAEPDPIEEMLAEVLPHDDLPSGNNYIALAESLPPPPSASMPEVPYAETLEWIDGSGFVRMTTTRAMTFDGFITSVGNVKSFIEARGGKPFVRFTNQHEANLAVAELRKQPTQTSVVSAVKAVQQVQSVTVTPPAPNGALTVKVGKVEWLNHLLSKKGQNVVWAVFKPWLKHGAPCYKEVAEEYFDLAQLPFGRIEVAQLGEQFAYVVYEADEQGMPERVVEFRGTP